MNRQLIVVDDEDLTCELFKRRMRAYPEWNLETFLKMETGLSGITAHLDQVGDAIARQTPGHKALLTLMLDLNLSPGSGLELVSKIPPLKFPVQIVFMSVIPPLDDVRAQIEGLQITNATIEFATKDSLLEVGGLDQYLLV